MKFFLLNLLLLGLNANATVTGSSPLNTMTLSVTCNRGVFASAEALIGVAPVRLKLDLKAMSRNGDVKMIAPSGESIQLATVPNLNRNCGKNNFYYLNIQLSHPLVSARGWVPGCQWNINGTASGHYYSGWLAKNDAVELIIDESTGPSIELGRAEYLPPHLGYDAYPSNALCNYKTSESVRGILENQ